MKKAWVYASVLIVSSSCAWSIGWGILSFPSYDYSAREACSKFDIEHNGELAFIFDMQTSTPNPMGQPSKFGEILVACDARSDWQTSRGTLEAIWNRLGETAPSNGWVSEPKTFTFEELNLYLN